MTATLSTNAALFKTLYPNGVPYDETYNDFPFLALINRDEGFYGDSVKIPLKYGNNAGRSATFSVAQANNDHTKNVAFFLTHRRDYAVATLDHLAMEASEKDPGAFVKLFQQETEGAMKSAIISEAHSLASDGSGIIGQIKSGSAVNTTTIELADPESIVFIEVGHKLQLVATKTGAVAKAGILDVVGVDRNAGTFTVSAAANTLVLTIAAGDYIAMEGDLQLKPSGFTAWIPDADPSATPFYGVDRTADIVRLSGVRDDFSSLPIEEALVKAIKRGSREGANTDFAFMNFDKFAELENALGSKVQYVDVNSPIGIGFRGIKVNSGKRPVTVLADITVPTDRLWTIQSNTWKLHSLKKSIRLLEQDGNKSLRMAAADASEVRIGGYKNFACYAPAWNGNFKI